MADKGLKRTISFGKSKGNSIEANVVHERGGKVKSRFFEFTDESKKKIKLLGIRFS